MKVSCREGGVERERRAQLEQGRPRLPQLGMRDAKQETDLGVGRAKPQQFTGQALGFPRLPRAQGRRHAARRTRHQGNALNFHQRQGRPGRLSASTSI